VTTAKPKRRWKGRPYDWPGQLTPCQRRFLAFLLEHGPATLDLLGAAADKDQTPKTEPGLIRNRVVYPSPIRVGAAVLVWLREWGFVERWRQDGHEYWTITERGSAALQLVRGESK